MKKVLDRSNTPRTINLHEGSNRRGSNSQQHERRQSHHHILGPLTYLAHERYQNRIVATNTAPSKKSKTSVRTTSTDKEAGYSESSHPTLVKVIMAVAAVAFAVVVTLPSALLAFLLIQSLIQRLQGIWNSAVDATHIAPISTLQYSSMPLPFHPLEKTTLQFMLSKAHIIII